MTRWCQTLAERYESKVDRSGGADACHPWTAGRRAGYGRFWVADRNIDAHRVGYELAFGPVPDGLMVRHICDNPPCQNAAHWLLGSMADNMRDMRERERHQRGSQKPAAKLTESAVLAIRAEYATGTVSQRALADKYGTNHTQIGTIVRREGWTHV